MFANAANSEDQGVSSEQGVINVCTPTSDLHSCQFEMGQHGYIILVQHTKQHVLLILTSIDGSWWQVNKIQCAPTVL